MSYEFESNVVSQVPMHLVEESDGGIIWVANLQPVVIESRLLFLFIVFKVPFRTFSKLALAQSPA